MNNQMDVFIERIKEAVDGECDGLAISTEQARSILLHLFQADPRGEYSIHVTT